MSLLSDVVSVNVNPSYKKGFLSTNYLISLIFLFFILFYCM